MNRAHRRAVLEVIMDIMRPYLVPPCCTATPGLGRRPAAVRVPSPAGRGAPGARRGGRGTQGLGHSGGALGQGGPFLSALVAPVFLRAAVMVHRPGSKRGCRRPDYLTHCVHHNEAVVGKLCVAPALVVGH